jgi:regulator of protease activity HflC (stomatin/prohibitin superfamily)
MEFLIIVVLFTALMLGLRRNIKRIVVFEYERGILYVNGVLRRVLGPGAHWYVASRSSVTKLDLRPRFASLSGQEVLSADNVGLKLSLVAQYRIADPIKAAHASTSYEAALYLELQLALRELVGAITIDELLAQRSELRERLLERSASAITVLGLELLSVGIKDIMFPGELKRIFAQVVKAQKEGQAALERARGESAALRNLANAAKLLEQNPALMQLRLLQSVGSSSGNTLVLGLPSHSVPLPIKSEKDQRDAGSSGDGTE